MYKDKVTSQHLLPHTAKWLTKSDEERIQYIRQSRWIGYPRAKEALVKLEELLEYPQIHRMPNLLLIGDTNNGKTMLIHKFCRNHPQFDNEDGESVTLPVVFVEAPPVPDEGRFYNIILDSMFAPYRLRDRVEKKQAQIMQLFRYIKVKMLIIDEIHNILAGNLQKQRVFLNVLKHFGNELQIPIVGVGTREAYRAIQTDPQLSNRFEPFVLHKWGYDENFIRLLMSFEKSIPLRNPSNLNNAQLAQKLYELTDGYIGEVSRLVTLLAVQAIKDSSEVITLKQIDTSGWIPPSRRKKLLEGI